VSTAANNLFNMITTIAKNPDVLKNPTIKVLFNQYAQKIGVSPARLEMAEQEESEQEAQAQSQSQGQPDMKALMSAMQPQGQAPNMPQMA